MAQSITGGAPSSIHRTASSTPDGLAANDEYHDSRPPSPPAGSTAPLTEDSVAIDRSRLRKLETAKSEDEARRLAPLDHATMTPTVGEKAVAGILPTPAGRDDGASPPARYARETDGDSIHTAPFPNGYHFPPRHPLKEKARHGLAAFWRFFLTPWGFFWTVYGLNVVAWGGIIFLLLCNAAPAMCHPTCNDIQSPRRIWIEISAQVLTGLFCVPGWGLAPWRFRDLWYLLRYRLAADYSALQRLAGIHQDWFRLPGSQALAVELGKGNMPGETTGDAAIRRALPVPDDKVPNPPATGTRAPATAVWRMDFVVWCMVLNTFGQCALCGIMWGMNRYTRPSWVTGFLVAISCVVAMVGGLEMFLQGRKIKAVEGVPLDQRDRERLERDRALGIPHYNNLKDKRPTKKRMADLEVQTGRIGAGTGAAGEDGGEEESSPSVIQTARYIWFPRRKRL